MVPNNGAKSCGFVETEEGENGKCSFILTLDSDGHMEITPHKVKEEQEPQQQQQQPQQERICSGICSKEMKTESSTSSLPSKRRISIAILKHETVEGGAAVDKNALAEGAKSGGEHHDIVSIAGIQEVAALPRFVKIYNKDLGSKPSFVVLEDALVRKRIEETLQPPCHCNAQQQTSPCDIGAHTSSQTDEYLLEYAVRPQLVKRSSPRVLSAVQQQGQNGAAATPVNPQAAPHVTISFPPTAGDHTTVYPSCSYCSSCCACGSNHFGLLKPPTPMITPQTMGYYPHAIGNHCSHLTLPAAAAATGTLPQQQQQQLQYPLNSCYPHYSHHCLYCPISTVNMTASCANPHCTTCRTHGHHHSHGHCGNCFNQQQQQQSNYPTFGRAKRVKTSDNNPGSSVRRERMKEKLPLNEESQNVKQQENGATQTKDSSSETTAITLQPETHSNSGSTTAAAAAATSLCMARFGRTCLILRPTTPTVIPRLLTKRISRYTSVMAWPSGSKMIQRFPTNQDKPDAKELAQII